jgi:sugar lactone lactonase YvrE
MRSAFLQATFSLLLALAAACGGYDSTTPTPSVPDGLWTASGGASAILRLAPAQLSGTGERTPATAITTPSAELFPIVGVAFDGSGTLWVASPVDSILLGFPPDSLASSGTRAAGTVIPSVRGSLSAPTGIAFDSRHRLWVGNRENGTLVRFDPAQLAAGGAQVPAVVPYGPGHPSALAFDAAGSLWVADNQFHTVARYTAAELEAGSQGPIHILTAANSLVNPAGLAFDTRGNLWISNTGNQTVVAFTPAQLAGTGSPAPAIVLSSTGGSLTLPTGLAFDSDGSLWVVGGDGALTKFGAASLAASGAPVPSARLDIEGHSLLWSIAFWPRVRGVPVN